MRFSWLVKTQNNKLMSNTPIWSLRCCRAESLGCLIPISFHHLQRPVTLMLGSSWVMALQSMWLLECLLYLFQPLFIYLLTSFMFQETLFQDTDDGGYFFFWGIAISPGTVYFSSRHCKGLVSAGMRCWIIDGVVAPAKLKYKHVIWFSMTCTKWMCQPTGNHFIVRYCGGSMKNLL